MMETSKTKELTNFHYISLTDVGCRRDNNEDYLGYFDTINGHVFAVCDGCGGLPYGEKASQTVVNSLKFFFSRFYYKDPYQAMSDAIDYAQNCMTDEVRANPDWHGMATTLVLVLVRYNKAYYAHIGDSRIYLFSHRELRQLTKDDSYVQLLVDQGKISADEAEKHPRKNELVRVMGMEPRCRPHICSSPIDPNDDDLLLLCTDGLYNMVSEQEIKATLAHRGYIEDKGMDLVNTAKKNGGFDNITLQIIKFYNVDEPRTEQTPIAHPSPISKYRIALVIAIALVAITMAGIFFGLRVRKPIQTEGSEPQTGTVVKVAVRNSADIDSISKVFRVSKSHITIQAKPDGTTLLVVPVSRIITVRYFDDLRLLEYIYNTPEERIMAVNGLTDRILQPGSELIIP